MTWALWGRARARRDDELIALGETEMWVEFEFGLGAQRYRVWRQRSKKGRGQSDLHFYVWNPHPEPPSAERASTASLDRRWAIGSCSTTAACSSARRRSSARLRLDYETFINSAFLLQGRADSFTVKTASERKQILADILGLSRYDLYEERAKQEAQARKEQATRIQGEIDGHRRASWPRRDDYEARLAGGPRRGRPGAPQALRTAEVEQAEARLAVQERQAQARQLADLRAAWPAPSATWPRAGGQLDAAKVRLAQFEAVLAQRAEIEAGWAALQRGARRRCARGTPGCCATPNCRSSVNRARLAVDQARLALEAERAPAVRPSGRARSQGRRGQEQATGAGAAQDDPGAAWPSSRPGAMRSRPSCARSAERSGRAAVESERMKADGQAFEREDRDAGQAADTAACPLCGQPLDRRSPRPACWPTLPRSVTAWPTAIGPTEARARRWPSAKRRWRPRMPGWRATCAPVTPASARPPRPRLPSPKVRPRPTSRPVWPGRAPTLAARLAAGDYAPAERAELAQVRGRAGRDRLRRGRA